MVLYTCYCSEDRFKIEGEINVILQAVGVLKGRRNTVLKFDYGVLMSFILAALPLYSN